MINLEELSQKDLDKVKVLYEKLAVEARHEKNGLGDTGTPEVGSPRK
jgi:hypothetical protein